MFNHGVRVSQVPTSVITPVQVEADVPIFIGTAPVHKLASGETGSVNSVELFYSLKEAMETMGYDTDWSKYSLCEAIYAQFYLYAVAPVFMINVFDPSVHKTAVTDESVTLDADGNASLANDGLLKAETLTVKDEAGATTYTLNSDYEVDYIDGVITRLTDGTIPAEATLTVSYTYGDPTLVTKDDIIGGIDAETLQKTGIALADDCFPKFGFTPMLMVTPGYSHHNDVVTVGLAKMGSLNSHFQGFFVADIDDTEATKYTDTVAYKNSNNLTDTDLILCYGKLGLADRVYHQSTQYAIAKQYLTSTNDGVPYESPSNKSYGMDRVIVNGEELVLGPDEANYLNGQGIITALNFIGGWKCWGNYTACYPSNTDVKDYMVPIRSVFFWFASELIRTFWQKVDKPMTKRLIDTIVDSANYRLAGLAARGFILGGRVEFNEAENNISDLMGGSLLFHLYITPPGPAQDIHFQMEYDPDYLQTLFG